MQKLNIKKVFFFVAILSFFCSSVIAQDQEPEITKAEQINPTSVELYLSNDRQIIIDFYGDHIFRLFNDSLKNEIRPPHADPPAQILVNNPRRKVTDLNLEKEGNTITISTPEVAISFDKQSTLFNIKNLVTDEVVVKEVKPIEVNNKQATMVLKEHPNEYFY